MATLFEITYEAGVAGNALGAESLWDTRTGTHVYEAAAAENGALGVKITGQASLRKIVTATNKWRIRWYHNVPVIASGTNSAIAVSRGQPLSDHRSGRMRPVLTSY